MTDSSGGWVTDSSGDGSDLFCGEACRTSAYHCALPY